ncbi:MAG: ComEC/Rec2 family competence protein [Bacillota bacterium]|jgi:competence protein ComEC
MSRVPLIYWAALSLVAGIVVGTAFPWPPVVVMGACLLATIPAVVMLWKPSPNRGAKSLLVLFFLYGLAHSNAKLSEVSPSWIEQKSGQAVTVVGQIVSIPEKVGEKWGRFVLKINEVDGQAVARESAEVYCQWPGLALVTTESGSSFATATGPQADLAEGSIIRITGKTRTAQEPANPGESDERLRFCIAGIKLRLEAWDSLPAFLGKGRVSWLRKIAIDLRANLKKITADTLPFPESALMVGIMLGSKAIPADAKEAFTKTGVVHILSVSGLHVSLVAAAISWLLKKLRLPGIFILIAVTGCIWLYILICGLQSPALRSGIMTIAGLMGSMRSASSGSGGSRISGGRRLVLAAIILLLINPLLLWDAGFQLSFSATAGIFMVAPVLSASFRAVVQSLIRLRRGLSENKPIFVSLPGAEAIACSLGVFLTVLPLNALYFNSITPISLISNIIVVPLASAALYLGLIAALAGLVFLSAAQWLNSGTYVLLKALELSAQALAHIPGGTITLAAPDFPATAVYYAILICVIHALHSKTNPRPADIIWRKNTPRRLLLVALTICAALTVHPVLLSPRTKVIIADVGQGCAALVQFASGTSGLIDCGPVKSSGASVIANLLQHYGVRSLDFIIISHGHSDHCGALPALLEEFRIRQLIFPPDYQQRPVLKQLADQAVLQGVSVLGVWSGCVFESGTACIEVLWPEAGDYAGVGVSGGDENGRSLTVRIKDQGCTLLLPGDLGTKELRALAKTYSSDWHQLDAINDAWVVAHHGSAGSYCPEFYQAADPALSIVSVGTNGYGHPSGAVLQGLIDVGSRILLTQNNGAVTLIFNKDAFDYYAWRDRGLFGLWRWRKRSSS